MTLGLYGGSFNPPHIGHVEAARSAIAALALDRLIWMPSGDPPHKELPKGTPSVTHRLKMSELAAAGLPNTIVSDYELAGGARYTVDTVRHLLGLYRPKKIYLLMGRDMGDMFDRWYKADELRALCEVYVFPRTPESSTDARKLLAVGRGEDLLNPSVFAYIRKEGLYGAAYG
ncbi:MAG: nicotinate-nicotinamide nucleotide adenylyltransferase [Oscillospiraceae bacterium]|nr:nicotinate-nicotinamide nucleotide adenylyltransferase [Oscillospiraceae bacterium]